MALRMHDGADNMTNRVSSPCCVCGLDEGDAAAIDVAAPYRVDGRPSISGGPGRRAVKLGNAWQ
jgi:hypothetical protein